VKEPTEQTALNDDGSRTALIPEANTGDQCVEITLNGQKVERGNPNPPLDISRMHAGQVLRLASAIDDHWLESSMATQNDSKIVAEAWLA